MTRLKFISSQLLLSESQTGLLSMINETTSIGSVLGTCIGEQLCGYPGWEISLGILSLFTLTLNILHLLVLGRLKAIKGTAHLYVLRHSAASNIFLTISHIFRICPVKQVLINSLPLAVVSDCVNMMSAAKHSILALGSVERAIALGRPLTYHNDIFVCRINLWLCTLWASIFLGVLTRDLLTVDDLCISGMWGPLNITLIGSVPLFFLFMFIPSVIMVCGLSKIIYELRQISRRQISTMRDSNSDTFFAKFITATSWCYIVFGLLPLLLLLVIGLYLKIASAHVFYVQLLLHLLYDCLDVGIYAYMSKTYQQTARLLLQKTKCLRNSVAADNKHHPVTLVISSKTVYESCHTRS